MLWPLIVVRVNGVGVESTPAPPPAMLPGSDVATAPGESTSKQASLTLRPVSTPPPSSTSAVSRAVTVTLKKSLTRVSFAEVLGLLDHAVDLAELRWRDVVQAADLIAAAAGQARVAGAVMQNGLKSAGVTRMLSVTRWLPNQLR